MKYCEDVMEYCKDAKKLLGKEVVCGKDCPLFPCLRLTIEDALGDATEIIMAKEIKAKKR